MYVWWLNRQDCEAIGEALPSAFPEYLCREYQSRLGRNGRGRLWVDKQFGDVSVTLIPSPLGDLLGLHYGGIVIRADSIPLVRDLPGLVTDLKLRRVI